MPPPPSAVFYSRVGGIGNEQHRLQGGPGRPGCCIDGEPQAHHGRQAARGKAVIVMDGLTKR